MSQLDRFQPPWIEAEPIPCCDCNNTARDIKCSDCSKSMCSECGHGVEPLCNPCQYLREKE